MLRPSDNFDLSVTYGYLDAKYDSYFTNAAGAPPTAATDFSHRSLVRAPQHSINVGGEWRIPTGDDSGLTLRADYALLAQSYHEPGDADPIYGCAVHLSRRPHHRLLTLLSAHVIGLLRLPHIEKDE